MATVSTINSNSPANYSIENPIYWTPAKIKRAALAVFAAIAAGSAIATGTLAPTPFAFLAIPLVLASLALIYLAIRIKEYDNFDNLKLYTQQATGMTFNELLQEHGLKNVVEYRLVSKPDLIKKFNAQVESMDFISVCKSYDLAELLTAEIITPEHVGLLKKLQTQAAAFKVQFDDEANLIDLAHRGRTDLLKKRIQQAKLTADVVAAVAAEPEKRAETYAKTAAVTTSLAFIGDLIAERAGHEAQETYEQRMTLARVRYHNKVNQLEEEYSQFKRKLI